MTMQIWKLAAGAVVTLGVLSAQGVVVEGSNFQQANTMGRVAGAIATPRGGAFSAPITGRPLSGTEERKTVQTLGDGTQLENSDSNLFYRDSQGRTRTETTVQGKTTIRIVDPVAHTTIQLDPATKTAHRIGVVIAGDRIGSMPQAAPVPQIAGGHQLNGATPQIAGGHQPVSAAPQIAGGRLAGGGGG